MGYLGGIAVSLVCLFLSALTKDYTYASLCLGVFLFSFFTAPLTVIADVWLTKKNLAAKVGTTNEVTTGFRAL